MDSGRVGVARCGSVARRLAHNSKDEGRLYGKSPLLVTCAWEDAEELLSGEALQLFGSMHVCLTELGGRLELVPTTT